MSVTKNGRVRRTQVSIKAFLGVYTPMARDGKSLEEIAKRCNEKFKPTVPYDALSMSQRASTARKYLRDNEDVQAALKANGINTPEALEKYIADHVPQVGGQGGGGGRKSDGAAVVNFLNDLVPAESAEDTAEDETETEATAE